jgi:hypothetical protein
VSVLFNFFWFLFPASRPHSCGLHRVKLRPAVVQAHATTINKAALVAHMHLVEVVLRPAFVQAHATCN